MIDKLNEIRAKLAGRQPSIIGMDKIPVFAVAIPMIREADGTLSILFEVRSSALKTQPGDICLPGGRSESGETPEETALRELSEELLTGPGQAEMLGPGNILYTGNLLIHTFCVMLRDYKGVSNEEVAETFTVPLDFFLHQEPEQYAVEWHPDPQKEFPYDRIAGGENYGWRQRRTQTFFYQWQDRTIWGITAAIMRDFAKIVVDKSVQ